MLLSWCESKAKVKILTKDKGLHSRFCRDTSQTPSQGMISTKGKGLHSRFVHPASTRHDGDTCDGTDIRIEKPGVVLLWKRARIKHNAENSL